MEKPVTSGNSETAYNLDEVIAEIKNQQTTEKSWHRNLFTLLISVFIFFQLGLLKSNVFDITALILVLFIHEIGHLIGMRLFGYRNIQMLFIPFLGAAVSGEKQNAAAYKKALVTFLGPAFGIFWGVVFIIIYKKTKYPIYFQLAMMSFVINGFNLLPFTPLDGGRFLQEVLFSRNRYLELIFNLLAGVALLASGYFLNSWILAIIGVSNLIFIRIPFKLAAISQEVKKSFIADNAANSQSIGIEPGADAENIQPDIVQKIIPLLHKYFTPRLNAKTLATYVRQVWEKIQAKPPRVLATTGLLCLYSTCFCFLLVGTLIIAISASDMFTESKIVEYTNSDGQTGRKEQYYIFGKLTSETEIAPNQPLYHGKSVSYYDDGKIKQEGNWSNGQWDGEWKNHDRNGNLICITILDHGKFVVRKERVGDRWVEKNMEDLPWTFRKVYSTQQKPRGPKSLKKIRDTSTTKVTK